MCGNTIFASSKHPVARYGPMTRVARVRRNTRCGVPLHSFGGHRCDRNTNPECSDARKLVEAGCPPKKCCRNTQFLQCTFSTNPSHSHLNTFLPSTAFTITARSQDQTYHASRFIFSSVFCNISTMLASSAFYCARNTQYRIVSQICSFCVILTVVRSDALLRECLQSPYIQTP